MPSGAHTSKLTFDENNYCRGNGRSMGRGVTLRAPASWQDGSSAHGRTQGDAPTQLPLKYKYSATINISPLSLYSLNKVM